jgi:hypothetical protein
MRPSPHRLTPEKRLGECSADGAIVRRWPAHQLWSHSSDEGGEWLFVRLGSPPQIQTVQSPPLHMPCLLIAAAEGVLTWEGLPGAENAQPLTATPDESRGRWP